MNSEKKFYAEIPESSVDPKKVDLAQKALDLLVKILKTERPKLRWLKLSEYDYKINRAIEALAELVGQKRPINERSYLEIWGDKILGIVRRALSNWKTESIFISTDCPENLIVLTVAHEFYHWYHQNNLSEEDAERFDEWFEELFKRHQNQN